MVWYSDGRQTITIRVRVRSWDTTLPGESRNGTTVTMDFQDSGHQVHLARQRDPLVLERVGGRTSICSCSLRRISRSFNWKSRSGLTVPDTSGLAEWIMTRCSLSISTTSWHMACLTSSVVSSGSESGNRHDDHWHR